MFGRREAVRVQAAEDALAKGRLDEAFQIALSQTAAGHGPIQPLLERLAQRLLERGQDHLLSQRFTEALADFDRAARCGHETKKVHEWRKRALDAMQDHQKAQRNQAAALAAARHRLAAGSLAGARDALGHVPPEDQEAAAVSEAIRKQGERAKEALAAARTALKAGDVGTAVERLHAARKLHDKLDGLTELEAKLVGHVVGQATEHFKRGRIDRANQALALLADLGSGQAERDELQEALRLARKSAKALKGDHYARAGVLLARLAQVGPKADWVTGVRDHLAAMEKHRRALLEGPLGMISGRDAPSALGAKAPDALRVRPKTFVAPPRQRCRHRRDACATGLSERTLRSPGLGREGSPIEADHRAAAETLPAGRAGTPRPRPGAPGPRPVALHGTLAEVPGAAGHDFLPKRLLLRIDGVGSFLLLRPDRVSLGRAGPDATADLPLISDLSDRQAEIVRAGEDYFLMSASGVELAGRQVDYALLQHGDGIRLSRHVRLKFLRPSLKSNTAALDLADGVRTTTDCRRVILWSGPLLMGCTRECHIRLGPGLGGFILLERGGQLLMKPTGPDGQWTPIVLGVQTEVGGLRLSAQAWTTGSGPGRAIG